jgi:phosphoglycolate phosphatase
MITAADLIIFDFDGTLCETRNAIAHCLSMTFDNFGRARPERALVWETIGKGIDLRETIRSLCQDLEEGEVDNWIVAYREIYNDGEGQRRTELFPGVQETLHMLTDAGCRVVVVSNKGERAVQNALSSLGIGKYVDLAVCDRPGVKKKPDAASYVDIIRPTFSAIGADRTIVVGDTTADIQFARNCGLSACWAAYGYGDADVCYAMKPDIVIDRPLALCDAVIRDVVSGAPQ